MSKILSRRQLRGIQKGQAERARRQQKFAHRDAVDTPARQPVVRCLVPNLQQLLIVASLAFPALKPGLIDRLLVLALSEALDPLIILTKLDLTGPGDAGGVLGLYRGLGLPVLATSVLTGAGLDELRSALAGRASALCGHSGAGKSSLLKALNPALGVEDGAISAATGKGRHTTTTVRLWRLDDEDTQVFDLPGLKELPLDHLDRAEIQDYFPEFVGFARRCRFADCCHEREPGCAVMGAVEASLVSPQRYASYLRILQGG